MRAVVPYDGKRPKTRLAPMLTADERAAFSRAMLDDVLAALSAIGAGCSVLSTVPLDTAVATVVVDDRPLTDAVNRFLDSVEESIAVVMADLALATPDALTRLTSTEADVAIVPGRGGGTNALVVRHDEFRVDYHGGSYLDHRRIAREIGASVSVVDSYRLGTDVDEPADLVEVLLHGEGRAATWLADAGFEVATEADRVRIRR